MIHSRYYTEENNFGLQLLVVDYEQPDELQIV